MTKLAGTIAVLIFIMLFAGCPDGAGLGTLGQDGGADASSDGSVTRSHDASHDGSSDAGDAGKEGGTRALCGADGGNDCGSLLSCDETLGCVECRSNADCPAAAALCLAGTCVGCRPGASDCPSSKPACWSSDDECHETCSDSTVCPTGTTCHKVLGACLGCLQDSDCASGVCSITKHTCVECVSDASCTGALPRCRVFTSTCVACTSDDDCGRAAPTCDPSTFTCRK